MSIQNPEEFHPSEPSHEDGDKLEAGQESGLEQYSGEQLIHDSIEDITEVEAKVSSELGLEPATPDAIEATDEALIYVAEATNDSPDTSEADKIDAVSDVVIESAMEVDSGAKTAAETPMAELDDADFDRMFKDIEARFNEDDGTLPTGHEAGPLVTQLIHDTEPLRHAAEPTAEQAQPLGERGPLIRDIEAVRNIENENVGPEEAALVNTTYNALIEDMLLGHIDETLNWKWANGRAGHGLVLETLDDQGNSLIHVEVLKSSEGDGEVDEGLMRLSEALSSGVKRPGGYDPDDPAQKQLHERISIQLGGEKGEAWTYFAYEDGSVRRINSPVEIMNGTGNLKSLESQSNFYAAQKVLGLSDYQISMQELEAVRTLITSSDLKVDSDTYRNLVPPK